MLDSPSPEATSKTVTRSLPETRTPETDMLETDMLKTLRVPAWTKAQATSALSDAPALLDEPKSSAPNAKATLDTQDRPQARRRQIHFAELGALVVTLSLFTTTVVLGARHHHEAARAEAAAQAKAAAEATRTTPPLVLEPLAAPPAAPPAVDEEAAVTVELTEPLKDPATSAGRPGSKPGSKSSASTKKPRRTFWAGVEKFFSKSG